MVVLALSVLLGSTATTPKTPPRAMAAAGQTVWVILTPVKADKRTQYERFVNEIFWPCAAKVGAADQQAFHHTRVLNPTKPQADGTYAYMFIMDPVQKGADYEVESLLKKAYGPAKATEYYKLYTECMAGEQKIYSSTQTQY
ncbi:hypothetical protein I2I01_17675 [Hymenobacter sp. BT439]|uniref:Uncharacterized protein n=1 Tax=Hymenobacter properus TaxID=2791026 RepID=A0A931BNE3_9BACT|nr:hypothetical protein [Hymenobacter properus]